MKNFEKIKFNSSLGMFQRLFGVWNGNINEVLHITFWPIFFVVFRKLSTFVDDYSASQGCGAGCVETLMES